MSRSAHPADFPIFASNDDPKRKGAAFAHRLLAQHFRKEEDRLAPSIGVRRRRALKGHLRTHAAYYVIIGRHGAIYVGGGPGVRKFQYPTQGNYAETRQMRLGTPIITAGFRRG